MRLPYRPSLQRTAVAIPRHLLLPAKVADSHRFRQGGFKTLLGKIPAD